MLSTQILQGILKLGAAVRGSRCPQLFDIWFVAAVLGPTSAPTFKENGARPNARAHSSVCLVSNSQWGHQKATHSRARPRNKRRAWRSQEVYANRSHIIRLGAQSWVRPPRAGLGDVSSCPQIAFARLVHSLS